MPLVRGHYPSANPLFSMLGGLTNATQSDLPPYTNATYFGGVAGLTDTAAATTTAKATVVVVPVDLGATITKVSWITGATVATVTHLNVQLYGSNTGVGLAAPVQLGTQSTDITTAQTASQINTITLGAAVVITQTNCPNGFVYVSIGSTASTPQSFAAWATPVAIGYTWNTLPAATTSAPLFPFAADFTGGGATQPATLAGGAARSTTPLVILT